MTTREENLKKINDKLEMLSDEELEKVVGGFMTAYFFLCGKVGDKYVYTKDPIAVGVTTDPVDFLKDNIGFFADAANKSLIAISDTYPSGTFQKFADNNASCWTKPARWGNVVFSLDVTSGSINRYEA